MFYNFYVCYSYHVSPPFSVGMYSSVVFCAATPISKSTPANTLPGLYSLTLFPYLPTYHFHRALPALLIVTKYSSWREQLPGNLALVKDILAQLLRT